MNKLIHIPKREKQIAISSSEQNLKLQKERRKLHQEKFPTKNEDRCWISIFTSKFLQ